MDNTTKGIIICLIIFYIFSLKMLQTGEGFRRTNGQRFSILELQLPKSKEFLQQLIRDLGSGAKESVNKQLNLDYIYMFGAYTGVALMCLKAREFVPEFFWSSILTWLAIAQIIPWVFDILENVQIRNWTNGGTTHINLGLYKAMAISKFIIALVGALGSILIFLLSKWLW